MIRPIVNELKESHGKVLLVDSDEAPIAELLGDKSLCTVRRATQPQSIAELNDPGNQASGFDRVFYLSSLNNELSLPIVEELSHEVAIGGDLVLVCGAGEDQKLAKLDDTELAEFRLVDRRLMGSLGTGLTISLAGYLRRSRFRHFIGNAGIGAQVLLGPLLLLLYANFSLIVAMLNLFGRFGGAGIATILVLRRQGVRAAPTELAPSAATSSLT